VKVGSAEDVRILRTSKLEYVSRLSVQCREDACRLRISSKPRVSDSAFMRPSVHGTNPRQGANEPRMSAIYVHNSWEFSHARMSDSGPSCLGDS
jgi:hypothetical protein